MNVQKLKIGDDVLVNPSYDEVDSAVDVFRGKVGKVVELALGFDEEVLQVKVEIVDNRIGSDRIFSRTYTGFFYPEEIEPVGEWLTK